MYLTAHRIRSQRGESGINAFFHKHGDTEVPDMSWDSPDIRLVADMFPGSLVAESVDIAPGNNQVLSYLDVVAVDTTEEARITEALEEVGNRVEMERLPLFHVAKGIGIRFELTLGKYNVKGEEYKELKARVLRLLENPVPPAWKKESPLIVEVKTSDRGLTFSLDGDSVERVREKYRGDWTSSRVTVDSETKDLFEKIHGDVIRHIIPVLTGLTLEQVAEMGGVRLRNVSNGQVWEEWPKRS